MGSPGSLCSDYASQSSSNSSSHSLDFTSMEFYNPAQYFYPTTCQTTIKPEPLESGLPSPVLSQNNNRSVRKVPSLSDLSEPECQSGPGQLRESDQL